MEVYVDGGGRLLSLRVRWERNAQWFHHSQIIVEAIQSECRRSYQREQCYRSSSNTLEHFVLIYLSQ